MKKKLIAIAVVTALVPTVAMAESIPYGRIHASLDSVSGIAAETNNLSLNTNSSRFGIKGSEELDGGLKAIYQIEASVSANGIGGGGSVFNGTRDTFVGLAGGFGTLITGRLPAANQYVYDSNLFADQLGDAANFTAGALLGKGRASGALHYVSPNFSGMTAALTFLPGKSVTDLVGGVGKNSTGVKLSYAAVGVKASLTTFSVATVAATVETKVAPMSLAGSYDFGKGMASAQYVKSKTTVGGVDTDTTSVINVGAKFNVSEKDAVKAQMSKAGVSASGAANGATMLAVGFDHGFSKNTGVYVVFAKVSNDTSGTYSMNNWGHQVQTAAVAIGDNPKGLGVGLTHNF
jgi:predicted porin